MSLSHRALRKQQEAVAQVDDPEEKQALLDSYMNGTYGEDDVPEDEPEVLEDHEVPIPPRSTLTPPEVEEESKPPSHAVGGKSADKNDKSKDDKSASKKK